VHEPSIISLTAEALQTFLDAVEPARGGRVTAVAALSGGYSRDTAIADVVWGDGRTERVVLRSDPPPGTGVFQSERDPEWRLLQALGNTGPMRIPAVRWYDSEGKYFGTKCIVSEFYESQSLQDIARASDDLAEVRNRFVDIVVDIHRTPLDALPPDLPCPADWDGYIDALVNLLDHYSRSGADSRPALRYTAARLRSYRPAPVPLTLVHGDCQPGNVLVGSDGPVVIDWEFARVGDPREDIGYYSEFPVLPNLYADDPEGFLARYRERTGLTEEQLNPEVIEYFHLLGLARLYGQEMDAADAIAKGEFRGIMAGYLVNAISNEFSVYFDIARRLGTVSTSEGVPR
jgi:aminoglycoside phosphotransferase (APT) family kinase protein